MLQFAEYFADEGIVSALSTQLSWRHFVEILSIEDLRKRDFYAKMCRIERWSVRTLRHKIGHLLFERTAVAKKPDVLIKQTSASCRHFKFCSSLQMNPAAQKHSWLDCSNQECLLVALS